MSVTCGISSTEHARRSPSALSGRTMIGERLPRALPWANHLRAVGAKKWDALRPEEIGAGCTLKNRTAQSGTCRCGLFSLGLRHSCLRIQQNFTIFPQAILKRSDLCLTFKKPMLLSLGYTVAHLQDRGKCSLTNWVR